MKKIVILAILISYSASYAQNTNLKASNVKQKYENVFYRSPQKYNNQVQKFNVTKIEFITSYKGSKSKNMYQIGIEGFVNNKKEQVIYNATSIDDLEYHKSLFKGRYKKITLLEVAYKVNSKQYYDTTISVEY